MVTWHLTIKLFPVKCHERQHCENCDVKRETVHCYLPNVDRCCSSFVNNMITFSTGLTHLLCYITNRLMTQVPRGTGNFVSRESQCFPRISMFPEMKEPQQVRTFQAVLSSRTAQSGATSSTTALHKLQDSLGCRGRVVGIACCRSPSWLHPWDVGVGRSGYWEPHSFHTKPM